MNKIEINIQEKYKLCYLVVTDLERKKEFVLSTNDVVLKKHIEEDITLLENLLNKLKGDK